VNDPRVSHLRLTAHLGLALAIFAALFWIGLTLVRPRAVAREGVAALRRAASAIAALVFVMALTGGLVAGIRAGFAYNTFPSMNGHVVPPEILLIDPWYRNFFDNMATVQFDHRLLAWTLALVVPLLWWRLRRHAAAPRAAVIGADLLLALLVVQVALGVATLLLRVPVPLAAMHQAGAVLLFAAALNVAHALRRGT
jgi:cytochrome c oxidase assembly protein subunit 15